MELLLISFAAGALTIAAPCILPLLPIIVGGSISQNANNRSSRPYIVILSLVVSIVIFTLLLKFSTTLLGVSQSVWQAVSGGILIFLGASFIWPLLWEYIPGMSKLNQESNKTLSAGYRKQNIYGDIVMGAALGPVFNSCSPTYLFIVAAILPISFGQGFLYLLAYAAGLGLALLLIGLGGQKLVTKLGWVANGGVLLKKVIGVVFITVGLAVLFGVDRDIQTYILDRGWYNPLAGFEESLRD